MGDRSPKSTDKASKQKQVKAATANDKKKQAAAAQKDLGKKR